MHNSIAIYRRWLSAATLQYELHQGVLWVYEEPHNFQKVKLQIKLKIYCSEYCLFKSFCDADSTFVFVKMRRMLHIFARLGGEKKRLTES